MKIIKEVSLETKSKRSMYQKLYYRRNKEKIKQAQKDKYKRELSNG